LAHLCGLLGAQPRHGYAGGHLSVPLLGPLTFAADVLAFDNRLEQLFALELL
jgi:hypothetical protein